MNLDVSSLKLFSYPCIQLLCAEDFKKSLKERFFQNNTNDETATQSSSFTTTTILNEQLKKILNEDLFGEIQSKKLADFTGLLNSLKFEVFVKKCGKIERNWPASFRTW